MNKALRRYMASAIAEEVKTEIDRGDERHGDFHSLHEALAVLREEYSELEQDIFWGVQKRDTLAAFGPRRSRSRRSPCESR